MCPVFKNMKKIEGNRPSDILSYRRSKALSQETTLKFEDMGLMTEDNRHFWSLFPITLPVVGALIMYFLFIFMLPFSVVLDTCGHFCGTYLIVVIFACRVSSLSVGVHRCWVLLNLVLFAMLSNVHSHFAVFVGRVSWP